VNQNVLSRADVDVAQIPPPFRATIRRAIASPAPLSPPPASPRMQPAEHHEDLLEVPRHHRPPDGVCELLADAELDGSHPAFGSARVERRAVERRTRIANITNIFPPSTRFAP